MRSASRRRSSSAADGRELDLGVPGPLRVCPRLGMVSVDQTPKMLNRDGWDNGFYGLTPENVGTFLDDGIPPTGRGAGMDKTIAGVTAIAAATGSNPMGANAGPRSAALPERSGRDRRAGHLPGAPRRGGREPVLAGGPRHRHGGAQRGRGGGGSRGLRPPGEHRRPRGVQRDTAPLPRRLSPFQRSRPRDPDRHGDRVGPERRRPARAR